MPKYQVIDYNGSSYYDVAPGIFFTLSRVIRENKVKSIVGDLNKIVVSCDTTTIIIIKAYDGVD